MRILAQLWNSLMLEYGTRKSYAAPCPCEAEMIRSVDVKT